MPNLKFKKGFKMAISPVASTIYANQVAPAASNIQSDLQAKFDIQNALAAAAANEEQKRVEQTRPAEQSHQIDPENEQEKNPQNNQEQKKKKQEQNQSNDDFSAKDFGQSNEPEPKLNIVV